jgi:hypothetical protein
VRRRAARSRPGLTFVIQLSDKNAALFKKLKKSDVFSAENPGLSGKFISRYREWGITEDE